MEEKNEKVNSDDDKKDDDSLDNVSDNIGNQPKNKSSSVGVHLLQLEDSNLEQIPHYIENIIKNSLTTATPSCDVLVMLLYCIALESGFMPIDENLKSKEIFSTFWGYTFHRKNVEIISKNSQNFMRYDDTYYKIPLQLINAFEKCCFLLCIVTGDLLCVTLTPENEVGKSISLSIPRYVLAAKNKNIISRFRNLKELSNIIKGNLFSPIRNLILENINQLYPGLNGIPTEILFIILKMLPLRDIHKLSKTNKRLRQECIKFRQIKT